MRSLFVKVFLWFWVATILSGLALFVIAVATHSGPPPPPPRPPFLEQWRRAAGQTLALYGRGASLNPGTRRTGQPSTSTPGSWSALANIRVLLFRSQQAICSTGGHPTAARAPGGPGRDERQG